MSNAPAASELQLDGVDKRFGATLAVNAVDLTVEAGSLVALLGPSGCGKTTTLRMIAGFETPDRGRIMLAGRDITTLPPNRRGLGMVFQNYSLFPHKTVAENVVFGLRMAGVGRAERDERVRRILDLVQLPALADRHPAQLSGGQQQRVALARSLIVNPHVLLLDEPLGALDKALRESMQFELRSMQRRLGITTLLVTHDQEEALSMSDRVAVMNDGRLLQVGAPSEIYDRPTSRFVAEFLGASNLFEGRIIGSAGERRLELGSPPMRVALPSEATGNGYAVLSVRPERMALGKEAEGLPNRISAEVVSAVFRGTYAAYQLRADGLGREILVYRQADGPLGTVSFAPGDRLIAGWQPDDAIVVEEES